MSKNWIAGATRNKGALHRQLGVPEGKKIPAGKLAAAAKKGGVEGKRARLAQTLKNLHGSNDAMHNGAMQGTGCDPDANPAVTNQTSQAGPSESKIDINKLKGAARNNHMRSKVRKGLKAAFPSN